MRLNLGMALERLGDARGALEQLEEALRFDPELATAHYGLGTLLERSGRDQEAIERYTAAVTHGPRSWLAHLSLADALRRTDRLEQSLNHYTLVLELAPDQEEARFGEAMALVRLGRYQEAQERLMVAMKVHPDQPAFPHALARRRKASHTRWMVRSTVRPAGLRLLRGRRLSRAAPRGCWPRQGPRAPSPRRSVSGRPARDRAPR